MRKFKRWLKQWRCKHSWKYSVIGETWIEIYSQTAIGIRCRAKYCPKCDKTMAEVK